VTLELGWALDAEVSGYAPPEEAIIVFDEHLEQLRHGDTSSQLRALQLRVVSKCLFGQPFGMCISPGDCLRCQGPARPEVFATERVVGASTCGTGHGVSHERGG
jgi:hypothetical protein